jgi:hypothetical protein
MDIKKNIWIGLAEIYVLNDNGRINLKGAENGFVNVLARAVDKTDFIKKTEKELSVIGLGLKELEDAELMIEREKKFVIDEDLRKLVHNINSVVDVQFGSFHVYKD